MNNPANSQDLALALVLLMMALTSLGGCESQEPPDLRLADCTPGERLFLTRIVIVERAKAVALNDRPTGDALLDSLATAWGDSARQETAAGFPTDPLRAQQVAQLLDRILKAELDSLILAPRPDRLGVPLTDPPAELPAEDPAEIQTGQPATDTPAVKAPPLR